MDAHSVYDPSVYYFIMSYVALYLEWGKCKWFYVFWCIVKRESLTGFIDNYFLFLFLDLVRRFWE